MDYKELIERLRDLGNYAQIVYNDFEIEDCMLAAATAIETLLAEREAAGWISVEDSLPEDDPNIKKHVEGDKFGFLTVLVYNGVVKQTNRFFCNTPKFGLQMTDGWKWASSDVTHWMPLPTPPDMEQKETADGGMA